MRSPRCSLADCRLARQALGRVSLAGGPSLDWLNTAAVSCLGFIVMKIVCLRFAHIEEREIFIPFHSNKNIKTHIYNCNTQKNRQVEQHSCRACSPSHLHHLTSAIPREPTCSSSCSGNRSRGMALFWGHDHLMLLTLRSVGIESISSNCLGWVLFDVLITMVYMLYM